ncbi:MAG: histidine phosphatase family protein [Oligoflexia bacterium]|nr:histidine phosphatase family protein [Oligoflexia bacterium]
MNLLVIRHAMAEEISQTGQDKDRPLSAKGRERFNQFCKHLSFLDLQFDLLLESHLLRAQQTADIFCKYFSVQQRERSNNLDPSSEPESLLLELASHNLNSIAVIGHQPFLSRFINFCLTTDEEAFIIFKRGAMAFLDFSLAVQPGSAQLKSLLDPKYFIKK